MDAGDGQASKPEAGNVMTRKTAPHDIRRVIIDDRCRRKAEIAKHRGRLLVWNGDEDLGAAPLMRLAGMPVEELIEGMAAAIEAGAIMMFRDRLDMLTGYH